jgi:hypothetical protein
VTTALPIVTARLIPSSRSGLCRYVTISYVCAMQSTEEGIGRVAHH